MRDIERVEVLFRRQLALETSRGDDHQVIAKVDKVSLARDWSEVWDKPREGTGSRRVWASVPKQALAPSTGFFNASRVPETVAVWMIVVGTIQKQVLRRMITSLCNIQSGHRSFRLVFALDGPEHIESMRLFGFTFQILASPDFAGHTRAEQIEHLSRKWGVTLCLDISRRGLTVVAEDDGAGEGEGDGREVASFHRQAIAEIETAMKPIRQGTPLRTTPAAGHP